MQLANTASNSPRSVEFSIADVHVSNWFCNARHGHWFAVMNVFPDISDALLRGLAILHDVSVGVIFSSIVLVVSLVMKLCRFRVRFKFRVWFRVRARVNVRVRARVKKIEFLVTCLWFFFQYAYRDAYHSSRYLPAMRLRDSVRLFAEICVLFQSQWRL